ncbi:MAG: peptidoglycan-binding protein, partial [Anaerolineae bacterium]|nr:peptidoglycan-binding protein [Anaerolineae bacterium]
PLFVLQGETPAYRDLIPGITGDDVLQLEQGLDRLGFDPGPVDGAYDDQTAAAVAEWYTTSGFQPFEPTADQLVNIRTLAQELALAINEKATAEAILAAAPLMVAAAQAEADNANTSAAAAAVQAQGQEREAAQAAVEAARLAGEVAVLTALDAQAAAEREVKRLDELTTRLADDLELAKSKVGVQIPIDELIFLPTLPARVEAHSVALGDDASGPVMTVTNNQLVIDSSLRLEEASLVKPGMEVAIDEPDLGLKATGVVGQVAETPGTSGVDGFHIYFEVLVDETPLSLVGTSLRLTIPVETTGGAVTAVPVSALSLAADGTSRVQVDKGGSLEFVTVEPGLSTDGYVEIVPVGGSLEPGQLVVIGFEQR